MYNKEKLKKTILYKILRKPYSVCKGLCLRVSRNIKKRIFADEYPLIKKMSDSFEKVATFREAGYEEVKMPDVYGLSYNGTINMYFPSIDMICIKKAKISENSDIIITPKGVAWRKVESPMFWKSKPDDWDLISYNEDRIKVLRKKKEIKVCGKCFSMLGQFDNLWSHFILQFFSKLVYASEYGLFNEEISILVPQYTDQNVIDAVHLVIDKYPHVHVVEAEKNVTYTCEQLYYITATEMYTAQLDIQVIYDTIVPRCTIETLKRGIVDPILAMKNDKEFPKKLYLVRRGEKRNLKNWKEIETLFESKGFALIEGHKYSLKDKIYMFHNATEIVGPGSASFMAIFACENTKIMMLYNILRSVETFITGYCEIGNSKMLMVTEKDLVDKNCYPHSSYYISRDRVEAAYQEFMTSK